MDHRRPESTISGWTVLPLTILLLAAVTALLVMFLVGAVRKIWEDLL